LGAFKRAMQSAQLSIDTWHHVQISYCRDDSGVVTYQPVWLDGVQHVLNATVPSVFALGWSQTLLTDFQVVGLNSSGTNPVYLDDLVIHRW
jgi:CHASE1-domain containing sensor protein